MYENQLYGFRISHSTTHAINYSVDYIESCLKDKKHVVGIFIDLRGPGPGGLHQNSLEIDFIVVSDRGE